MYKRNIIHSIAVRMKSVNTCKTLRMVPVHSKLSIAVKILIVCLLPGKLVNICLDYSKDLMKDNQVTTNYTFLFSTNMQLDAKISAPRIASEPILTFSLNHPVITLSSGTS